VPPAQGQTNSPASPEVEVGALDLILTPEVTAPASGDRPPSGGGEGASDPGQQLPSKVKYDHLGVPPKEASGRREVESSGQATRVKEMSLPPGTMENEATLPGEKRQEGEKPFSRESPCCTA